MNIDLARQKEKRIRKVTEFWKEDIVLTRFENKNVTQIIRSINKRHIKLLPIVVEANEIQKDIYPALFFPAHFVIGERHSIGRRAFIKTFRHTYGHCVIRSRLTCSRLLIKVSRRAQFVRIMMPLRHYMPQVFESSVKKKRTMNELIYGCSSLKRNLVGHGWHS